MNENPGLIKTIFSHLGCPYPYAWIGNNFCNDQTNNAECNYDGGDCCGVNVNTNLCFECACLVCNENDIWQIGDGFCEDETNNLACTYDGGDCCLDYVYEDYCDECL